MAIVNTVKEVLHRVKAKLYPSHLPGKKGKYIARTTRAGALSIEDICALMKNRGGYEGDYGHAVNTIKHYFNEAAYQLCDGRTVNTGFFTIQLNICGTFNSLAEAQTAKKEIDFGFCPLAPLRGLVGEITVEIDGVAGIQGCIEDFTDVCTGAVNKTFTPGGQFIITGSKIKLAGKDTDIGVYFTSTDGSGREIKAEDPVKNSSSCLIGAIPRKLSGGTWKITIKTRFTGATNTLLKTPRTIESDFTITDR